MYIDQILQQRIAGCNYLDLTEHRLIKLLKVRQTYETINLSLVSVIEIFPLG